MLLWVLSAVTVWWEGGDWTRPVDFIEVVRLQNPGADDADAARCSHLDVDMPKEDIEVAFDGGGVTLLGNGKLGAEFSACHGAGSGVPTPQRAGCKSTSSFYPFQSLTDVRASVFSSGGIPENISLFEVRIL